MSYILDALKKSDKKRQQGQVPDLHTIQIESLSEPKKQIPWPQLLLAIFILNAIIWAAFLRPWQKDAPEVINQQQAEQQAAQTAATPKNNTASKKPLSKAPAIIGKTSPPVILGTGDKELIGKQEKPQITALNPSTTEQPESNAGSEDLTDEDIEDQQASQVSAGIEPSHTAINPDQKPLARLPDTVNLQQKTPTPPMTPQQSHDLAFPEKEVLDILQLPSGIQQELPEFIIAAHVYSKKPASRLVSINGRILRQGHTLSPGLKVKEIAPDGVIFSYEDYFFKVGVF